MHHLRPWPSFSKNFIALGSTQSICNVYNLIDTEDIYMLTNAILGNDLRANIIDDRLV